MKTFEGKTIMITGATGLIGSHIVYAFMNMHNVRVIALSRNEKKLKACFKQYLDNKNFRYVAEDVSNSFELSDECIDYIFHAAGPMEGKIIKNQPVDVIKPNVIGIINCLELLKNQEQNKGIRGRLVVFSSVTVYGNIIDKDITVSEDDTQITENLNSGSAPYSQSKRLCEVIALAYQHQYNLDVVIVRFSTVYGATYFIPDTAFFEFIRKAVSGERITLNSSGLPRRDNIYIDDAVSGILTVAKNGETGEAYNISSNGDLNNFLAVDEIAQNIAEVANKKYNRKEENKVIVSFKDKSVLKRKGGIRLNNSKLKELGWSVTVEFSQGVSDTIDQNYKK